MPTLYNPGGASVIWVIYPSVSLSLSLSGVCVCLSVFLSVYLTVSTSSIRLNGSSQHVFLSLQYRYRTSPGSCNGCKSSTLSRYFTYSSAIAVDDSAKMSSKNWKLHRKTFNLEVWKTLAMLVVSVLHGGTLPLSRATSYRVYNIYIRARTLKKYMSI